MAPTKKAPRSQSWYGGMDRNALIHRGWMKSQGYSGDLFDGRPVIGICNTWSELTPCNAHFRELAEWVKRGVWEAGDFPLDFPVMALKNCGPKGYPGMPELGNMPLPRVLLRKGITDVVRISDAHEWHGLWHGRAARGAGSRRRRSARHCAGRRLDRTRRYRALTATGHTRRRNTCADGQVEANAAS